MLTANNLRSRAQKVKSLANRIGSMSRLSTLSNDDKQTCIQCSTALIMYSKDLESQAKTMDDTKLKSIRSNKTTKSKTKSKTKRGDNA